MGPWVISQAEGGEGEDRVLLSTPATVHTLYTPPSNLFSLADPSARRVPGYRVTQVHWKQYTYCTSQHSEPVSLADPSARTSLTLWRRGSYSSSSSHSQDPHLRIGSGGTFKLYNTEPMNLSVDRSQIY